MSNKRDSVHLMIDKESYKKLKLIAVMSNCSVSDTVNKFLDNSIQAYEKIEGDIYEKIRL